MLESQKVEKKYCINCVLGKLIVHMPVFGLIFLININCKFLVIVVKKPHLCMDKKAKWR